MKLSVAVVFAALFVVSYGADVMFFQDLSLTRMANLGTGEVKILGTSKQPARPATEVEGTGVDAMSNFALQGGNLYAYSAYDFQIWKYTQTSGALAVSVFSGATTGATAGATDGAATVAQYGALAGPLLARADGSLWFFDNTNAVVRKIAPDGGATTPLGVLATPAASTDGVGTSANFFFVNQAVQTKDGTVYFTEAAAGAKGAAGVIRKIAPDLAVTTIAGSNTVAPGSKVYTKVEGAGTNAVLSHLSNIALSKDEQSLYFVSSQIATASTTPVLASIGATAGTGDLLSYTIRKLDISAGSSFLTSVVLEQNQFVATDAADQVCKDGVGTSAVLCPINVMVADGDGNLIVNQIGKTSEVFKKVNVTAGSITTLAGNPVVAALQINPGLIATSIAANVASVSDGTGTNAVIIRPRSALVVQSVCGKLSALGSNVTITSDCEELSDGGSVPKLIIGGSTAVTKALTVQDSLAINSNGKLTANAPITVGSGIVLTGNGTLVINDQTVTANSLTLATETVYHVLVQNLSPKVLSVVNNAGLAGTIVVCIAKDFNFNVGANAKVLNFGSKTGAFAKVFLVKLRTAVARRSLLQAAGATVGCGTTSCIATGTNFAGDDDDEVGIIVALAIVGTLLALVLFGACFLIMKKTSDKNVEQIVAGQTAANFSYSSSSSSEVFGPQDAFAGYDYDYSY